MRLALLANPRSGGRTDPLALAERLRRHGAEVELFGVDPAERARAAASEPDRFVVAGGDGSIAPVAELARTVPLAVIPSGTANDFARAHGLPSDVDAALALAATGRRTERLELGRLEHARRPFVNVASAGLAPTAAEHAAPLKPRFGPLAYALGALTAGATAHAVGCRVRVDGEPAFDGRAWQLIVAVSGAFGGGSHVGAADPHDGRLDVVVVPAHSRAGLLRRAWGMRRGTIARQPGVLHERAREVVVDLPPGARLNVDGEVVEPDRAERLTAERDAFALVVP